MTLLLKFFSEIELFTWVLSDNHNCGPLTQMGAKKGSTAPIQKFLWVCFLSSIPTWRLFPQGDSKGRLCFFGVMHLATIVDLVKIMSCGGCRTAGPGIRIICEALLGIFANQENSSSCFFEIVMPQGCVLHFLLRLNLHEATCSECCSFVINHCGARRGNHGYRYVYVSFSWQINNLAVASTRIGERATSFRHLLLETTKWNYIHSEHVMYALELLKCESKSFLLLSTKLPFSR